jgi:hypothetical protein
MVYLNLECKCVYSIMKYYCRKWCIVIVPSRTEDSTVQPYQRAGGLVYWGWVKRKGKGWVLAVHGGVVPATELWRSWRWRGASIHTSDDTSDCQRLPAITSRPYQRYPYGWLFIQEEQRFRRVGGVFILIEMQRYAAE